MVVLPTFKSWQAIFTETASGLAFWFSRSVRPVLGTDMATPSMTVTLLGSADGRNGITVVLDERCKQLSVHCVTSRGPTRSSASPTSVSVRGDFVKAFRWQN